MRFFVFFILAVLNFTGAQSAPVQLAGTGRWFDIIDNISNLSNASAITNAQARTFTMYGQTFFGKLGQISSQAVQTLVVNHIATLAIGSQAKTMWISGTDSASEGTWKYNGGGSLNGQSLTYTNWETATSEPNGGTSENFIVMELAYYSVVAHGKWVDISGTGTVANTQYYLVEFSTIPTPGSLPLLLSTIAFLAICTRKAKPLTIVTKSLRDRKITA